MSSSTIYIAKPDYLSELSQELQSVSQIAGDLVFSPTNKPDVCFALDIWHEPQIITFNSISEAARILRQAGQYWYLYPLENIRRSHLITEQLRKLPDLHRSFPITEPLPTVGCFALLDKNTLVYSTKRWKAWPMGHCQFNEDKVNPPNRAYLKLWEALSLLKRYPQKGESALDLGASPGGWTYVMQSLGTTVTAIDKAPLDAKIARLPNVRYLQQSAFALDPKSFTQPIDWVLSDIACYPDKLYELVMKWLDADRAKQLIFTIKLQGQTDLNSIKKFQDIPNSRTLHLFNNKHEATFFYPWVNATHHLLSNDKNPVLLV